jgi:hypothetical protein
MSWLHLIHINLELLASLLKCEMFFVERLLLKSFKIVSFGHRSLGVACRDLVWMDAILLSPVVVRNGAKLN